MTIPFRFKKILINSITVSNHYKTWKEKKNVCKIFAHRSNKGWIQLSVMLHKTGLQNLSEISRTTTNTWHCQTLNSDDSFIYLWLTIDFIDSAIVEEKRYKIHRTIKRTYSQLLHFFFEKNIQSKCTFFSNVMQQVEFVWVISKTEMLSPSHFVLAKKDNGLPILTNLMVEYWKDELLKQLFHNYKKMMIYQELHKSQLIY